MLLESCVTARAHVKQENQVKLPCKYIQAAL